VLDLEQVEVRPLVRDPGERRLLLAVPGRNALGRACEAALDVPPALARRIGRSGEQGHDVDRLRSLDERHA
jgi:hypothetical protein